MNLNAMNSNPVFVVGFFRSGTSLLYSLLNQHPELALMYECDVWDFPEGLSAARFQGNWLERQEFFNQALSRHRLVLGGSQRGLDNIDTPESLYRTFSELKGAAVWGEKSPVYCSRLRQLAKRFPQARFILLWRDPVEIYQSILYAGRKAPFFRRKGMLGRLICQQEAMIRQAGDLNRAGARLHHVTYSQLVDDTEGVCRGICQFLGVEFDGRMLDLSTADFSAIDRAPHHDHLRRRIIQRQDFPDGVIDPHVAGKLQRFEARWNRLRSETLNMTNGLCESHPEPGLIERACYGAAGRFFWAAHNIKRAAFEFMPLPWLRTYRQIKNWARARKLDAPASRPSLGQEFRLHWITILVSSVLLGLVAILDYCTGPLILGPLYLIPCATLTLVIGRRWGTLGAFCCALIVSLLRASDLSNALGLDPYRALEPGLFLWNLGMRFVFFEIFVILLGRILIEINSSSTTTA
jgi:hypothetical protein